MTAAPLSTLGAAGECTPPANTGSPRRAARGYAVGKADYLTRLRKIEGRVSRTWAERLRPRLSLSP